MTWWKNPVPGAVFGIERDRLDYVRVENGRGGRALKQVLSLPFGEGFVHPGLLGASLVSAERLRELVEGLRARFFVPVKRSWRAWLVLPDDWMKAAIVDLPTLPRRIAEAEEMVRWKLKKTVPFRVDDLRLTLQELEGGGPSHRVLALFGMETVLASWEAGFAACGVEVGGIQNSSVALWNLATALGIFPAEGDVLMAHFDRSSFTLIAGRGGAPLFYRNKGYGRSIGGDDLATLVAQEIGLTLTYCEANLPGGSPAVCLYHCSQEADFPWIEALLGRVLPFAKRRISIEPGVVVDAGAQGSERLSAVTPLVGAVIG